MTEATAAIPDPALERRWQAIRAKLLAHADQLARQGTLVARTMASGRRAWEVRVMDRQGGTKIHRNIYITADDQPELRRRTRDWLDRCRAQGRLAEEVSCHARLAVAVEGIAGRLRPALIPARDGVGRLTSP
jgi:hypothetical protein